MTQNEIEEELLKAGAVFEVIEEDELIEKTAEDLSNGEAVDGFKEEWNLDQEL